MEGESKLENKLPFQPTPDEDDQDGEQKHVIVVMHQQDEDQNRAVLEDLANSPLGDLGR